MVFLAIATSSKNITSWIDSIDVVTLNEDNFEELTQATTGSTTGRWFIKFYAPVFLNLAILFVVVWSL